MKVSVEASVHNFNDSNYFEKTVSLAESSEAKIHNFNNSIPRTEPAKVSIQKFNNSIHGIQTTGLRNISAL